MCPCIRFPSRWNQLLEDFFQSSDDHLTLHRVDINGSPRYFNLHKAHIDAADSGVIAMLLEDQTENNLLQEQLIHSERLASIGQLAAGVAHEIGNPVTGIDCLAQELALVSDDNDVQSAARQIREQTQRVSIIVQSLVSYAHSGKSNPLCLSPQVAASSVCIFDCIEEAVHLLKLSHEQDHVSFQNHCEPSHRVSGNEQKLQQVFLNLLKNAADATSGQGQVSVSSFSETGFIHIHFDDEGSGIPEALKDKLFEPFFTTKESGKGTGLGLALTWNIIKEHCGSIQVISPLQPDTGQGSRFIISLPEIKTDQSGRKKKTTITAYQDHKIQGEAV